MREERFEQLSGTETDEFKSNAEGVEAKLVDGALVNVGITSDEKIVSLNQSVERPPLWRRAWKKILEILHIGIAAGPMVLHDGNPGTYCNKNRTPLPPRVRTLPLTQLAEQR